MTDTRRPGLEIGQPEHLRLQQIGVSFAHALARQVDRRVARIGQAQRGGQVDGHDLDILVHRRGPRTGRRRP
ncbi:MAG: hypothetical protein E6K70_12045 [Planctomycetota bacterium]|nr:MAG: hypothetical protein E6K70_12045 [Planctomycetota bacterium]